MKTGTRRRSPQWPVALCAAGVVISMLSGCADYLRRKSLHEVAKGWCETIRASQVIPVYPLTSDLRPGDVFMVQTPIARQADVYRERGFLALDDFRVRLGADGLYEGVYFDSFFQDPFKEPPHEYPAREAGTIGEGEDVRTRLSDAQAPRAAFPTYTFDVQTSGGLSLALPLQGVPVGLTYLSAKSARGSVTIADARTYAGDPHRLYRKLTDWSEQPDVRRVLAETARQASGPVYLRVVTRVYLTGAVVVSLERLDTRGAGVKAGIPPSLSPLSPDGSVNERFGEAMDALNQASTPVRSLEQAGGAFQFVAASGSSVTMAESFDTLLVIGYLGYDVPVYRTGDLGAPVPTFERLERRVPEPTLRADELTTEQVNFQLQLAALEAESDLMLSLTDMHRLMEDLNAREFVRAPGGGPGALELVRDALAAPESERSDAHQRALSEFKRAATRYVAAEGAQGLRYQRFADAFAATRNPGD